MTAAPAISTATEAISEPDLTLTVNEAHRFDLASYLDRYLADLDTTSPKTRETYRRSLMRLFEYLSLNNVERPTRADIIAYRNDLLTNHKSSTVQTYLTATKLFFVWTNRTGYFPNDIADVKGPRTDKEHKKDYLTAEQMADILTSIDRASLRGLRDYAMVMLMFGCGLRCVEVSRADLNDLRPQAGKTVLYVQGKGRTEKDAAVNVPGRVERAIRDYLAARGECAEDAPLFASTANRNRGGRITPITISENIKKIFRAAGYDSDRITAHSLRHTAVTLALLQGQKLDSVRQFARHANIQTTMIYNHSLEREQNTCSQSVIDAVFPE